MAVSGYLWDFDDGTTSTEQNPVHIFRMPGLYNVQLTRTSAGGSSYTITIPIRVYDYNYASGPNPSLTGYCYRLPVIPGDGYGPSEYRDSNNPGFDWIWPPAIAGTTILYTKAKEEVALVLDSKTQRPYQINVPDTWRDRLGGEYAEGNQIIGELHQKAFSANEGEHIAIVHEESHTYFKPYYKDKNSTTGYDFEGYPTDFRADLEMHKNDNDQEVERSTLDIKKDGDLVYHGKIEARTLQQRIKIYGAPWKIVRLLGYYDVIDKAATPSLRYMSEAEYQDNLSSLPLFHLTRNYYPLRNMATSEDVTGTYNSLIKGPDNRDYSALYFGVGDGFTETLVSSLDGDFTLNFWVKDLVLLPIVLFQIGNLSVTMEDNLGNFRLLVSDGTNPDVRFPLLTQNSNWIHLVLTRESKKWKLYDNKNFLGEEDMNTIVDYGTSLSFSDTEIRSLFDAFIVPRSLTQNPITYYYDDVVQREGNNVLVVF